MHITLIMPAVGCKPGKKYVASWKMEPLSLASLAALTPPEVDLHFFDDRLELISYEHPTDLVAINVETYTAQRAFAISQRFRERGVPVVMGGYHVTLMPDETLLHCDSIVVGEAEQVWEQVIIDAADGVLARRYQGQGASVFSPRFPRREIYKNKRYIPLTLIESGRGCKFSCKFCSIASFFKKHYHGRSIESIVEEIRLLRARNIFLIDDNIVSDVERAKQLFHALIPLGIRWISQGSITMAKDKELLDLMKRSGCVGVLIGFESLELKTLKKMGKGWNKGCNSFKQSVKLLHRYGIAIYATFMFGYDDEDENVFAETLQFAMEQRFYLAAFNHLVPFPGTQLYNQLEAEGRLLYPRWWLEPDLKFGDVVYRPINFTPEDLAKNCLEARKKFYSFNSILRRSTNWRSNSYGPYQLFQYLWLNFFSERAVHQRQGLPLGNGLD
jgi:radical SAM superfamily enzyme YgiQ (UPF0313 family)